MKKILITLLVIIFSLSFTLISSSCKKEVAKESVSETSGETTEATISETTAKSVTETKEENITLTIWWWGEQEGPGLEKWMNETIQMYEKEHPNIKIESVLQTSEGLYPAFRTAAEAKKSPDIQYMWTDSWLFEDVWRGNLQPITKYFSEGDLADMLGKDFGLYKGERYSISWYMMPCNAAYNKSVLEEAGIDVSRYSYGNPPITWEEFLKDCNTLKEKGFVPIQEGNKDGFVGAYWIEPIGLQYINKQSEALLPTIGLAKWTDYQYADWWKKMDQLTPYFNDDLLSIDSTQGWMGFGEGKAAFTFGSHGGITTSLGALGDNLRLMIFPKIGNGSYFTDRPYGAYQQLVVPTYAKHPKEACDFLKFMISTERANAMYVASKLFPSNRNFDLNLIKTQYEKEVYKYASEKMVHNAYQGFMPPDVLWSGVGALYAELYTKQTTPEKMAQKIEDISVKWRDANPGMLKNYQDWYQSWLQLEKEGGS